MRFRVERDVLAEAVAWAARSLPARPPVPVLAGLLLEADRDDGGLALSGFDYEVSARVEVDGRRSSEAGAALVLRSAARRHHPQPAAAGRSTSRPMAPRCVRHLRQRAVHAADAAGRGLPDAAGDAAVRPGPCTATRSRPRSPRSRSPPAATTRCRCSPASGSRSRATTLTLAATDRYRLAVRELTWTPEQSGRRGDRAGPGAHPRRHREGAGRGRRGDRRPGDAGRAARAWSASRAPAGAPRPGCSTASSRSTASLLPAESAGVATVDTAALVEAVRRVALVAERNTPVRLTFAAGEVHPRGRRRRRGPGVRVARRRARRATTSRSRSTRATCSTGSARSAPSRPSCRSRRRPSRRCSPARTTRTRRPATSTATCSCRCGSRADLLRCG